MVLRMRIPFSRVIRICREQVGPDGEGEEREDGEGVFSHGGAQHWISGWNI